MFKRERMCERERECVCVCGRLAKNEKALKMNRDKKKIEGKLGLGGGNVRVYCGGSLTRHYI